MTWEHYKKKKAVNKKTGNYKGKHGILLDTDAAPFGSRFCPITEFPKDSGQKPLNNILSRALLFLAAAAAHVT